MTENFVLFGYIADIAEKLVHILAITWTQFYKKFECNTSHLIFLSSFSSNIKKPNVFNVNIRVNGTV